MRAAAPPRRPPVGPLPPWRYSPTSAHPWAWPLTSPSRRDKWRLPRPSTSARPGCWQAWIGRQRCCRCSGRWPAGWGRSAGAASSRRCAGGSQPQSMGGSCRGCSAHHGCCRGHHGCCRGHHGCSAHHGCCRGHHGCSAPCALPRRAPRRDRHCRARAAFENAPVVPALHAGPPAAAWPSADQRG